jgi:chaperonin GroES
MNISTTFISLLIVAVTVSKQSYAFMILPPVNIRPHVTIARATSGSSTLEGRKISGEVVPVNNFILVKTVGTKAATDDGILLTGSAKIVKTQGTVISTGPGRTHEETGRRINIDIQPGEGVVYGEYDGIEIEFNGDAHMLIRDNNVLIKFSGEKLTRESVEVLNDNVLVQIDDDEQATAGGLILASSSSKQNRPSTGRVLKVGPGATAGDGTLLPMRVGVGDRVKFMDFAGNNVEIEGEEYSVVKMGEVLAKF